MLMLSEESRRMQDMMRQYGMANAEGMFGTAGTTLVLNRKHPLVQYLQAQVVVNPEAKTEETATPETENAQPVETNGEKKGLTKQLCEQLYDLACIQQGSLSPERMKAFIARSNTLMEALTK